MRAVYHRVPRPLGSLFTSTLLPKAFSQILGLYRPPLLSLANRYHRTLPCPLLHTHRSCSNRDHLFVSLAHITRSRQSRQTLGAVTDSVRYLRT